MAKSKEQILSRKLRKKGLSMKEIAAKIKVSKGSVSRWCSDIQLTKKQIEKLHKQMVCGSYKGRMIGVEIQKERKRIRIEECLLKAKKDIPSISKKELFIAGLSLYWGEGSKKSPGVRFYNSDPIVIKFIMHWFRNILKIQDEDFLMYVTINKIHKKRLNDVNKYWSEVTSVPIEQFRKPILIKSKNKKIYENHYVHYGTLCIRIAKSTNLFYQIIGWLKALGEAV
jgi:transcriptional regulator with XRE-family HTH domain